MNAGTYRVDVTVHTDPADPRGSIGFLTVADNSQAVVRKTRYKLLGVPILSKVEREDVDFTTGASGPKTVTRKILGIPYSRKKFDVQGVALTSNAVGRRKVINKKEKQLPKLDKI